MIKLKYMDEDINIYLQKNIKQIKDHYSKNDKKWFDKFFEEKNGLIESKYEIEDIDLDMNEDYGISDRINIDRLYNAMKDIPLSVALNENFWAGLTHSKFWDYIQYRRKEELQSNNEKEIGDSFFIITRPGRDLKRTIHFHCLSRLWWAGNIIDDKNIDSSERKELLDAMTKKQFASGFLILSSSNFIENKEVCIGFLKSLKKIMDTVEHSNVKISYREDYIKSPTVYLNKFGGATILDTLDRNDIEKLMDRYFQRNIIEKYKI